MKSGNNRGRTFYRILAALLSCVLAMAAMASALIAYQNRRNVKTHTETLANAMLNGASQIDAFWFNSVSYIGTLGSNDGLARLSAPLRSSLRSISEAQSAVTKSLSSFLANMDCAQEVLIYLYGNDSLLTPSGVTQLGTFFANRYAGDADAFTDILRGMHTFELSLLPFERLENVNYSNSNLVLQQSLYGDNGAIGTLMVLLDPEVLEETISRCLTLPNSAAYLTLNGVAIGGAENLPFESIPEGEYAQYLKDVGVVVRLASNVVSGLEYLAIDAESNVMSENGRIVQTLLLMLSLATLIAGGTAFWAARKLYTPLRTLLKELDDPVDAHTDEYNLLLKSIQTVNSDYANTLHALDSSSPLVRDALLYRMLRDTVCEDETLVERYLPAPFQQEHFYVFVAAVSFAGENMARDGIPAAKWAVARLEQAIGLRLLSMLRTGDEELALITYPLAPQDHERLCAELSAQCAAMEAEVPGGIVLCASGAGVAHIHSISAAFREAREVIRLRPITCEYAFLNASETENLEQSVQKRLPADYAHTLSALLRGGDFQKVWDYVQDLLDRCRQPDVTAAQYVKVAITINQQLLWTAESRAEQLEKKMIELRASHALIPSEQIKGILYDNLRILFSEEAPRSDTNDSDSITRYISENIASGVTLSSVAKQFGYNANYFSRYFKQLTGMTFTSYLNRTRIDRACKLLNSQERLSINEVAGLCGFNSSGQFISTFEKLMGITPGAYRKLPAVDRRGAGE